MKSNILEKAVRLDPELGSLIKTTAERRFDFRFIHDSSAYPFNYENLWFIESFADDHSEIDVRFRADTIRYVMERWRVNLRGYRPYQNSGYYVYLCETLAPKIGVMPLSHANQIVDSQDIKIKTIDAFVRPYQNRSWRKKFSNGEMHSDKEILKAITTENGSIGTRTAGRLKITVAQLRNVIEFWNISDEVNHIRKFNKRRPALLVNESDQAREPQRIYDEIWPKNY